MLAAYPRAGGERVELNTRTIATVYACRARHRTATGGRVLAVRTLIVVQNERLNVRQFLV